MKKENFNQKNSSIQISPEQKRSRLIKHLIISCLRRGKKLDLRLISCPITITKIDFSKNRSLIRCYFIAFSAKYSPEELMEAFNLSKNYIRYFLTGKLQSKFSPIIDFFYDYEFLKLEKFRSIFDSTN